MLPLCRPIHARSIARMWGERQQHAWIVASPARVAQAIALVSQVREGPVLGIYYVGRHAVDTVRWICPCGERRRYHTCRHLIAAALVSGWSPVDLRAVGQVTPLPSMIYALFRPARGRSIRVRVDDVDRWGNVVCYPVDGSLAFCADKADLHDYRFVYV